MITNILIKTLLIVFTFLLLTLIVFRTSGAEESTYVIDIYDNDTGNESVFIVIKSLLEHDSEYLKKISGITQKYNRMYSSDRKGLVKLDYVEARALHLKYWIVGIKKLKNLNGRSSFQTRMEYVFVKNWRSSEGRKELDGLYNGVQFLLVISGDAVGKNSNMKVKLQNLGDQVMLMEVCEYYRLMDDIDSLRKVKRSGKELNTAFNKNLVFLSRELKHLKDWYVEHARQG